MSTRPRRRPGLPLVALVGALVVIVVAAAMLLDPGRATGGPDAGGRAAPSPSAGAQDDPLAEGLAPGEAPPLEPGPDLGPMSTRDATIDEIVEGEQGYFPGTTWWVMLAEGYSRADAEALLPRFDGDTGEAVIAGEIAYIEAYQFVLSQPLSAEVWEEAARWLREQPEVAAVAADTLWTAKGCADELSTGDYARDDNGGAYWLIGAEKAWAAYFASGVPKHGAHVAVVDSQVGAPIGARQDEFETATFTGDGPVRRDASGAYDGFFHADGVMGLIAADRDDGGLVGLASPLGAGLVVTHIDMDRDDYGTAPATSPRESWYVASDGSTTTYSRTLINTMRAVEAGAKVINMSFGPLAPSKKHASQSAMWRRFLARMHREHPDVLFVVAAGNEGTAGGTSGHLDGHNYGAAGIAAPNLITVANVLNDNTLAPSSNSLAPGAGSDAEVTLAAPGDESFWGVGASGRDMNYGGGTSSAAPMVTAAAAMLRAINPQLDAAEIKEILVRTAQSGPSEAGGRTLDMGAAVLEVVNTARRMRGLPKLDDAGLEAAAEEACSLEVTAAPAGLSPRSDAMDWNVAAHLPLVSRPTHVTITVGGLRPADWRVPVGSSADIAAWAVSAPAPGVAAVVARADSGFWVRRWLAAEGAIPVERPTPTPAPTPMPTPTPPPVATPAPVGPSPSCGPPPPPGTIKYLEWAKRCKQIGG